MTAAERDEKLSRDLFLVPHSERLGLIAAFREEVEQAAAAQNAKMTQAIQTAEAEIENLRCGRSDLGFRSDW